MVASAFARDPKLVIEDDFAWTAWQFMGLKDKERLETVRREAEELRFASRLRLAMWDVVNGEKYLDGELDRFKEKVGVAAIERQREARVAEAFARRVAELEAAGATWREIG